MVLYLVGLHTAACTPRDIVLRSIRKRLHFVIMGRLNRQKKYRKILKYYKINFKISAPFKVILDGNFIHAALKNSVFINEKIPKILNDQNCDILVPNIVLDELEKLGEPVKETLYQAQTFKKHKYGNGSTPSEVILDIIGETNRHKFIICTQDVELRHQLQQIPGVPLIYMNKASFVIEPPSRTSHAVTDKNEQKKNEPKRDERRRLQQQMGNKALASTHVNYTGVNHKKRKNNNIVKQPNPLSVKKKKVKINHNANHLNNGGSDANPSTKKRRKRRGKK